MKRVVVSLYGVILFLITAVDLQAMYPEYPEYPETLPCQRCASTVFLPRPQGLNSAVGLNSAAFFDPFYYKCCDKTIDNCWTLNLGFRYDQTWQGKRLAECLYGTDTNGVLKFAGSQAATQATADGALLADDYGLAPTSHGSVSFDPKIQDYNVDFVARCELGAYHDCLDGFYLGLNATLTHTIWDLGFSNGTWDYGSGTVPLCMQGLTQQAAINNIKTALEGYTPFGELESPAQYGHFVLDHAQKRTGLANIDLLLGYDFVRHDGGHFGMFFKTVAPTGNRPNPVTTFSPIVGNAHHWEFGGGVDAHLDVWHCDDQCLSLYLTGGITHLFNDKQLRTFDVNGCCMSRNGLVKKLDAVFVNGALNNYVFTNKLGHVSDWTTREIISAFGVQGDASLKLMYRTSGWAFGVGYNVYGRSAESIQTCDENSKNANSLMNVAIKGTTGVCYTQVTSSPAATTQPTLNASQDNFCTKIFNTTVSVDPQALALVSLPGGTQYTSWDDQSTVFESVLPNGTVTSFTPNPTPLNDGNIDFKGEPRQIQHTIFGHIDYQWDGCAQQPFVGLGGQCSFANGGDCAVCTASQWGLWIHAGLNF